LRHPLLFLLQKELKFIAANTNAKTGGSGLGIQLWIYNEKPLTDKFLTISSKSGALHPTGENSQNEKKEAEKLITLAQKRITQN